MLMLVPTAGYIMESKLPEFHAPYRDAELFSLASELTPSIAFADARYTLFDGTANGRQMYTAPTTISQAAVVTHFTAFFAVSAALPVPLPKAIRLKLTAAFAEQPNRQADIGSLPMTTWSFGA